ncbi:ATP-binding protein [Bdellovibrio sp. 22V]|uniref:sensor histidine kinase n=1 Tax=Bdellovibrio sp. 22V TaxID=3044166 RepID=UPI0025431F6E|nr:ATP-binding protein [Bdellovibrio sp. 22V]WII73930.1 ATP-binding protein [Bdellovibrio sp. 22V]
MEKSLESEDKKTAESFKDSIKARWIKAVHEQSGGEQRNISPVTLDSMDVFLDNLMSQLGPEFRDHRKAFNSDMAQRYGRGRAGVAGYLLPQFFKEYSLLRQAINAELYARGKLTYKTRNIVDQAIDSTVSEAATEFATAKQEHTQEALTKAEISNRDLEQFAGVAAHDLKSPLATISGYLDLLDEELRNIPESPGLEYVEFMSKALERMRNLIERLLEYARLTTKVKAFQKVDLNHVVQRTLENLQSSLHETRTRIDVSPLPQVLGDVDLLGQVFQNLFANAIKFRSEKPLVITVRVDGDINPAEWRFSVSDNGLGFDPKQKENIFGLYTTLHSGKNYQGAGIGLATCRKVVENHGGKIWAESEPGKGSHFYFTIPKI